MEKPPVLMREAVGRRQARATLSCSLRCAQLFRDFRTQATKVIDVPRKDNLRSCFDGTPCNEGIVDRTPDQSFRGSVRNSRTIFLAIQDNGPQTIVNFVKK